jgi:hypothetical protein
MKKILLAAVVLLMTVASGSALAEWVWVASSDKVTAYADPSSMRKKLNIVKLWTLFDYKTEGALTDGSPFLSVMRETEFNCKDNFQRMTGYSIHSGRLGKGKTLESGNEPQEWKPVSRSAMALQMKKFACKAG